MSAEWFPDKRRSDLSADNEETLRQLVQTIRFGQGLTVLFARCNVPIFRQQLAREAVRRLAVQHIDVVEVDGSARALDLRQRLREQLAESTVTGDKRAIFLYGLEHAIPRDEPDAPLLVELNMGRELFHRDAPYPLVFWLPDFALTALARGAPDFWAWRSGVFEFETEPVYRQEALQIYVHEGTEWLTINNLTADEKRKRRSMLENLLADYQELAPDRWVLSEQGEILFTLAQLNLALGELQHASQLFQQSLELRERLGDQAGIASSLYQLSRIALDEGNYGEAHRLNQRSLELREWLGDQAGIASSLYQLGNIALEQGEYTKAQHVYRQSLELREQVGDQSGIATSLHQLGWVADEQNDAAEATRLCRQSLEINRKLGNQAGIAGNLALLATAARAQGDYAGARRLQKESLELSEKLGNQLYVAANLALLGDLALYEGDYAEARHLLQQSLEIFERLKLPQEEPIRQMLAGLPQ